MVHVINSLIGLVVCGGIGIITAATDVGNEEHEVASADESKEIDAMWVLLCGFLVIFMQTGFAMLEAGSISSNHIQNIVFKNFLDMTVGALMFFLLGYGFAFGDSLGGFIGMSNFAMHKVDSDDFPIWFFQFAFASVATTIVSGAMGGRCKMEAYFIYSLFMTSLVYPIVAHWVWNEDGWLAKMNIIDFAGCGVVHMTGGWMSLIGALMIGPRIDRYVTSSKGTKVLRKMRPNNVVMQTLGVFILWFGWYGFNAGSTFQVSNGVIFTAAKIAINTTLAGAVASLIGVLGAKYLRGYYDLGFVLNCSLAGLVSIIAACSSVTPVYAIIIGIVGSLCYMGASEIIVYFHIDDPLDSFPIHGAAGFWGLLAVGIFSSDSDVKFEVQLLGCVVIALWSMFFAFIIFKFCEKTVGLRVSSDIEADGIDVHEHGGVAYTTDTVWTLDDVLFNRSTRKALMGFMKAKYCEESLEFLLECKVLFDALDMDSRIEFLSDERDCVPAVIEVKKHVYDLVTHIVETYIAVMSEKEININSTLKSRITNEMTFKGESVREKGNVRTSGRSISARITESLSQRVGFLRNGVPIGTTNNDGFIDIESQEEEGGDFLTENSDDDQDGMDKMVNVDISTETGDIRPTVSSTSSVSASAPATGLSPKAKDLTKQYAENSKNISISGLIMTNPTKKLSKEFMLAFIDAYKEIHRLVFQNFYFSFSHTEACVKARVKAEAMDRRR